MASSPTEIANLALSFLGRGVTIDNLDTDQSAAGKACRQFYDLALKQALREMAPSWASTLVVLGLVEDMDPEVTREWAKAYTYPADCVIFHRISSGSRNDSRQSRVPFRKIHHDGATLLLCDLADAVGEYTALVDDVERYPSDFVIAQAHLLGSMVAPRLTTEGAGKLASQELQFYEIYKHRAMAYDDKERQRDEPQESEFIRSRS